MGLEGKPERDVRELESESQLRQHHGSSVNVALIDRNF